MVIWILKALREGRRTASPPVNPGSGSSDLETARVKNKGSQRNSEPVSWQAACSAKWKWYLPALHSSLRVAVAQDGCVPTLRVS